MKKTIKSVFDLLLLIDVIYREAEPKQMFKIQDAVAFFEEKWNSYKLWSGRISNNTDKDSCWYSYW